MLLPRRIRLGTIFGLLVIVTTIPLGLFAGGLIWTSWQQQRALVDRQNVDTARAISVAVDQDLRATIAALNVLAAVESLETWDEEPFEPLARRMLALHPGWEAIHLVDPMSGRILVDAEASQQTDVPPVPAEWVHAVRDSARPSVSLLQRDPTSGRHFIDVGVPVIRGDAVKYVLGARLATSPFSDLLRRQNPPAGGVVALLDASHFIIARTRNEDRFVGRKATDEFVERTRLVAEGSWRATTLEGTPAYSAYSRSLLTGWTVGVALPTDAVDAPILRSLLWLIAAGSMILSIGIVLAMIVRRRIVRAQLAAAAAARALASSEPIALPQSRIAEVADLSDGLRDAAAILERRLQERNEAERERALAREDLEHALAAEQEARAAGEKNEVRLAVTLRSIGDAVITTDASGRVTLLNRVAQALTGWNESDAIGQPIERVFPTLNEQNRQPYENVIVRVTSAEGSLPAARHALLMTKRGQEIPVADSTAPILAADGTLLGAIVVFRDITAERDADRQRAALLDREQAARRAAEALNRAKDEFVATVSHELRTPLNAIFGWVAMLRTGALDGDRQKHALEVIHRNTIAQAHLIEDLLDMSRVIRGTVRLDMQPIDLAAALETAVDTLRPTAVARQIAVEVRAERGIAIVSGDQDRLQQVIWNVLSNSLKFTPHGGRIEARLQVIDDEAVVRITDTGEGIAPEFLPHVFDRFRQEMADVTRAHSGLGIGLSLVRHLTELHGGRIAATSEGKGKGATFTIALPLLGTRVAFVAEPSVDEIGTPLDSRTQPLHDRHLLVVDDDKDARDLIATVLTQAGARATTAASVSEALSEMARETPDAVVTDIAMPNATGYDLVRHLRADPRTASLPIIAITAYNRAEDRDRAIAQGFDAHVGKPFDPRAIVGLISGLVQNAER